MISPPSRDSVSRLVDATGLTIRSDEHRAEMLANKRQRTREFKSTILFSVK